LHQEVQVYGLITEELARAERVQGWDVFTLERRLP
jgi:nucleoside-triphosphatase THEP1